MSLLELQAVSISIGDKKICQDFDLQVDSGQVWGVLGGNGVGKTTLLNAIAGLHQLDAGEITVLGKALVAWKRKELARKLGILFQDSSDTFPASVYETAISGRYPYLSFLQMESAEDRELVLQALRELDLEDMQARQVDTLSGGERRRLAIATLMIQNPRLWLLDEPTNHLDLHQQISLLDLLLGRVRQGEGGALMVLHDVNLLSRYCSHAVLMINEQKIVCGPTAEVLSDANLSELYQHPVQRVQDKGKDYFFAE